MQKLVTSSTVMSVAVTSFAVMRFRSRVTCHVSLRTGHRSPVTGPLFP